MHHKIWVISQNFCIWRGSTKESSKITFWHRKSNRREIIYAGHFSGFFIAFWFWQLSARIIHTVIWESGFRICVFLCLASSFRCLISIFASNSSKIFLTLNIIFWKSCKCARHFEASALTWTFVDMICVTKITKISLFRVSSGSNDVFWLLSG